MKTYFSFIAILTFFPLAFNAENAPRVKNNFDKCYSTIERSGRTLNRIETELLTIKSNLRTIYLPEKEVLFKDIESIENSIVNHKERLERTSGMADKINSDLQNLSGPTCPSCIVSSVNLYCRNADNLSKALSETSDKVMDIQIKVRTSECRDKAGIILLNQAHLNLKKADSLFLINDTAAANRAFNLYETLTKMAIEKCNK
jgi:seryl-tRNA synthetase